MEKSQTQISYAGKLARQYDFDVVLLFTYHGLISATAHVTLVPTCGS